MGCLLKQGGGLYPRLRIGAVLLAAGGGARMGGVATPLIRLQGVPLVCRQLVALSGAGVDEVVVVTGHAKEAVEEAVRPFTVSLAHDERRADDDEGRGEPPWRSARVGLAALSGPFDAVFVVPAGLPLIGAADLTELIGAFKKRPSGHVVVPFVDGRRGDPILLDALAVEDVLAGDGREPGPVHRHESANPRYVTALDTVEEVRALARRTGWRLELPEASALA